MNQTEEQQQGKKMPLGVKITMGVLITSFCCATFLLWDESLNNSYYFNKIVYGSDCAYQVPAGYSIYYSPDRKRYAVKVNEFENYYLYNGKYGITTMYSTISEPALFKDSCEAKAYLKAYIYNQRNRFE